MISQPHFYIPICVSIIGITLLIWKRKSFVVAGTKNWWMISLAVFFGLYLIIMLGALHANYSLAHDLQQYDLNGDGIFSGDEITPEQHQAIRKVSSDTARTFAFITGLIFSAFIALSLLIAGKSLEYVRNRRH